MWGDFSVYGSWEPLDSLKILPRDVGTFSTIGKPLPRNFQKCVFCIFPENRRRPSFIIPRSRHLAFFGGGWTPPDFSGMSNYVDSLPAKNFLIQESQVFKFSVGKSKKTTQYGKCQIWCFWCAYSIISLKN